jgi:hypothetical protein
MRMRESLSATLEGAPVSVWEITGEHRTRIHTAAIDVGD